MAITIRGQAADEPRQAAPLRHSATWDLAGISISDARHAVRGLLARAGHRPDHRPSQDAQLVVSELVTNALRHAPGPGALLLELTPGTDELWIAVHDSSPRPPEVRAGDAGTVGGHGLRLVTRLCEQVQTVPSKLGKQVLARLVLRTHAG
ncbi:ATP-binding protein [Streptomyces sp. NPDC004561]